jgi:hypothetical protein
VSSKTDLGICPFSSFLSRLRYRKPEEARLNSFIGPKSWFTERSKYCNGPVKSDVGISPEKSMVKYHKCISSPTTEIEVVCEQILAK